MTIQMIPTKKNSITGKRLFAEGAIFLNKYILSVESLLLVGVFFIYIYRSMETRCEISVHSPGWHIWIRHRILMWIIEYLIFVHTCKVYIKHVANIYGVTPYTILLEKLLSFYSAREIWPITTFWYLILRVSQPTTA